MTVIKPPKILIPRSGIDLHKWAIIACDQYTSEPEYWYSLSDLVGNSPSTLHMIFPEVYLGKNDDNRILSINTTMNNYINNGIFQEVGECFILVDRSTSYQKKRLGLIVSIDLDQYEYSEHTDALIRATERTVVSRIPPRVKIRQDAIIEIPHVLVLVDDRDLKIIENLYDKKDTFKKIYDFELNMNGGHLSGYKIDETHQIIKDLESLTKNNLLFIVGDGNHSLATAKACWDAIKIGLNKEQREIHPSRYAMIELMNIHDKGLQFEPIHRIVFNVKSDFLSGLTELATGNSKCITYSSKVGEKSLPLSENAPEAIRVVQDYIDLYIQQNPEASVDYVHGLESLKNICHKHPDAIGITLPPIDKKDIFDYVSMHGVLPRKSFSMGEASEKRYYLECRKIK
jgi:uncharacterized protein (DUF1015 family)